MTENDNEDDEVNYLHLLESMYRQHSRFELRNYIESNAVVLLSEGVSVALRFISFSQKSRPSPDELRRYADLLDQCRTAGIDAAFSAYEETFDAAHSRFRKLFQALEEASKSKNGEPILEELLRLGRDLAFARDSYNPEIRATIFLGMGQGSANFGYHNKNIEALTGALVYFERAYEIYKDLANQRWCFEIALVLSQISMATLRLLAEADKSDGFGFGASLLVMHKLLSRYIIDLDYDDPRAVQLAGTIGLLAQFESLLSSDAPSTPVPAKLVKGSAASLGWTMSSAFGSLLKLALGANKAKPRKLTEEESIAKLKEIEASLEPMLEAMRRLEPGVNLEFWLQSQLSVAEYDLRKGERTEAVKALKAALQTGRHVILTSTMTEEREKALAVLSKLAAMLADIYAEDGDLVQVYWTIARGRSVRMSLEMALARLETDPAFVGLTEKRRSVGRLRVEVADLQAIITSLGQELRDSSAFVKDDDSMRRWEPLLRAQDEFGAKSRELNEVTESLLADFAANHIYASSEPPSIEILSAQVPKHGAAAIVTIGEKRGWLLIVPHGVSSLKPEYLCELPHLTTEFVKELLESEDITSLGWISIINTLKKRLSGPLEIAGPELAAFSQTTDRLTRRLWDAVMGPLDGMLRKVGAPLDGDDVGDVFLMPPGQLSVLPLQAAWRPDASGGQFVFLDTWALSICQSPQAIVAAATRLRQPGRAHRRVALGVTDPLGDLAAAVWRFSGAFENPALAIFESKERHELRGGNAHKAAVLSSLKGMSHIAFYSHGVWNPREPSRSGLILAPSAATAAGHVRSKGGLPPHELLTLADLRRAGADLVANRLWILAACETWGLDMALPDEFSGLGPSLAAEVPAVFSTLYPVDAATTDLVIRAFMRVHVAWGKGPARALRLVQLTMRNGRENLRSLARIPDGGSLPPEPGRASAMTIVVPMIFAEADEEEIDTPLEREAHQPDDESVEAAWRQSYFWAAYSVAGL